MRRHRSIISFVIVTAVLSVGGLVASTFVKSPEEQRATAAAPVASVLTAPVERRILTRTLVVRGTVAAQRNMEITPVVNGAATQVVTAANVEVGSQVNAGDVLLAVSGRPLISLAGTIPIYRDLRPGQSGDDIKQLQAALKDLRHYRGGDKPGFFGENTKNAVRSLYNRIGYDPADTGGPGGVADRPALDAAADAVEAAQHAVAAIQRRIDAGETAAPAEEPLSVQLRRANEKRAKAQQTQAELASRTGIMLPLAEAVFTPELPAQVSALSAMVGSVVQAPLITLAVGELQVSIKLRPDEAKLVQVGMPATLVSETMGTQAAATVATVGPLTIGSGESGAGPHHAVQLKPDVPLPAQWSNLNIRVTVIAAQTKDAVLIVPLSAVSSGPDGRTTVSVNGASGITRVQVHTGASGDGYIEVQPIGSNLGEGDNVIVGMS